MDMQCLLCRSAHKKMENLSSIQGIDEKFIMLPSEIEKSSKLFLFSVFFSVQFHISKYERIFFVFSTMHMATPIHFQFGLP